MLVSREAVLALMPHHTLTKISGEPTHAAMKHLEKELKANLIAVDCPWGLGRGYLGELLPAAIYTAQYGAAYTPPDASPPPYPIIPHGAATAIREELRATNEEAQKNWQTMLSATRLLQVMPWMPSVHDTRQFPTAQSGNRSSCNDRVETTFRTDGPC